MTIQPARHECHACYPLHAEKPGIQPVVGNTHGTRVEQVVSSFQKILRGSQLTWYIAFIPEITNHEEPKFRVICIVRLERFLALLAMLS